MRLRYRSKVTRKGQITITAEARRQTGIKVGDPVDVVVEDGRIVGVEPAGGWAERTYGIFKGSAFPLSEDEMRKQGEEAWVEAAIERDERSKRGEQSKR